MKEIRMPSAGQTTDEAVITKWLVKVGDKVERGDILLEAETDKTTLPVESFARGVVIDILVEEGVQVDGGDVLALVGNSDEALSYRREAKQTETKPVPQPDAHDDYVPICNKPLQQNEETVVITARKAMPNAKKLAKELGIDLSVVPASGEYIKVSDVERMGKSTSSSYTVLPQSRMRRTIAKRMCESTTTIPAFQASIDINMGQFTAFRDEYREAKGVKLSFNDLFTAVLSRVSSDFPLIKARYEQNELRLNAHLNVGIAVALDDGLIVPVIQAVETLELSEIASKSKALIEKAKTGTLLPADTSNGSTTISNLGMYGIRSFSAIINPPESCIFALGTTTVKPQWNGSAWIPVPTMTVTGSFDHRFIDGALGAQILQAIKRVCENPMMILM